MLLLLALACADKSGSTNTSDDTSGDTSADPSAPGTLALTFAMDADYIPEMDEEPIGRFWGDVYAAEDVSGIGPSDGAQALASVYVESVDLRPDGGPTAALWTSDPLAPQAIVVLGFLDSDANADPGGPGPDDDDPVTLPGDNAFSVLPGAETTVEVYFGLLNP